MDLYRTPYAGSDAGSDVCRGVWYALASLCWPVVWLIFGLPGVLNAVLNAVPDTPSID